MPSTGTVPGMQVAGGVESALELEQLRSIAGERLAEWLMGRRWFGSKAGAPRRVRVLDSVRLPDAGGAPAVRAALCRIEVELADGRVERYQWPLALLQEEGEPGAALARVESGGATAWLCDAVHDDAFARALLHAFASGESVSANGVTWKVALEDGVDGAALASAEPVPLRAEQSNSSIRCGSVAMLKLYRKLEAGPHPEVEMARYLTRVAGFAHVPALLGVGSVKDSRGSEVTCILQALVPHASDCWELALKAARNFIGARGSQDPPNTFEEAARELGRVTREMHESLAAATDDPALMPADADVADVMAWAGRARSMMFDSLDLLARAREAGKVEGPAAAASDAVLRRRRELLASLDDVASVVKAHAGLCIRIHGDYHLGQVLRDDEGRYWIMDFEGEPARLLAERRARHSALRDVAGMLRSFAYAAAVAAHDVGGVGVKPVVELRLSRWERTARAAFLAGYEKAARSGSTLLPRDEQSRMRLLEMFEAEKVFYELAYELNNRPEWTWIPLRGVGRLLGR